MSLLASLASVYFFEIQGNPIATLCWIQRMLIFGVFLVTTIDVIKRDTNSKFYALPFVLIGVPLAVYQQLVHWDIIKVNSISCATGFVCSTKFFNFFGFISQATLCLTAFVVVAICLKSLWSKKTVES
ncbi:disulfide bond formation protein B [bacterium]|nr:disulfide bond formation protein B [bacterium]